LGINEYKHSPCKPVLSYVIQIICIGDNDVWILIVIIYYTKMLCSGPKGKCVIFSTLPS